MKMIIIILICIFIAAGFIIYTIINNSIRIKKNDEYCGLYKDRELKDDGECPEAERCEECPYKRRIV